MTLELSQLRKECKSIEVTDSIRTQIRRTSKVYSAVQSNAAVFAGLIAARNYFEAVRPGTFSGGGAISFEVESGATSSDLGMNNGQKTCAIGTESCCFFGNSILPSAEPGAVVNSAQERRRERR
jgi:hypothetical protein